MPGHTLITSSLSSEDFWVGTFQSIQAPVFMPVGAPGPVS